jgi:hypothetical protein
MAEKRCPWPSNGIRSNTLSPHLILIPSVNGEILQSAIHFIQDTLKENI